MRSSSKENNFFITTVVPGALEGDELAMPCDESIPQDRPTLCCGWSTIASRDSVEAFGWPAVGSCDCEHVTDWSELSRTRAPKADGSGDASAVVASEGASEQEDGWIFSPAEQGEGLSLTGMSPPVVSGEEQSEPTHFPALTIVWSGSPPTRGSVPHDCRNTLASLRAGVCAALSPVTPTQTSASRTGAALEPSDNSTESAEFVDAAEPDEAAPEITALCTPSAATVAALGLPGTAAAAVLENPLVSQPVALSQPALSAFGELFSASTGALSSPTPFFLPTEASGALEGNNPRSPTEVESVGAGWEWWGLKHTGWGLWRRWRAW